MSTLDDRLNQLQADGRITDGDAEEVRRFADYLRAIAGKTGPEKARIYLEHYPEYAPTTEPQEPDHG